MEILYLKDCMGAVPIIANWFCKEWGDHYAVQSVEYISGLLLEKANKNTLPLTLVAVANEEIIGTVNLKKMDMDNRPDLSPWMGGLYVREGMRKQGRGARLIEAAVNEANRLGFRHLFLWTATAKDYYLNLGWIHLEDTLYEGKTASIFKKELS
jgi:N-acetylglutamate synthase-like GNAT family acetyltransferase